MFGKKKPKMRSYNVIISSFIFLISCQSNIDKNNDLEFAIHGKAQGTTYVVTIADSIININKEQIDSILLDFDNQLSTYNSNSTLSKLNKSKTGLTIDNHTNYFYDCYTLSQKINKQTGGLFDPSVYSLVNEWGFYTQLGDTLPSQEKIDSILTFTGFENGKYHSFTREKNTITFLKKDPRFKIDFNAIAQGYSVDVLANFLEQKGQNNFYIELGGEIRVKGKNQEGKNWNIGIETPRDQNAERSIFTVIQLTDCGIATSGNYRNFFTVNGKKYSHIINPKSGRSEQTDVLSATVIAKSAALADGYATAILLLGKRKRYPFN